MHKSVHFKWHLFNFCNSSRHPCNRMKWTLVLAFSSGQLISKFTVHQKKSTSWFWSLHVKAYTFLYRHHTFQLLLASPMHFLVRNVIHRTMSLAALIAADEAIASLAFISGIQNTRPDLMGRNSDKTSMRKVDSLCLLWFLKSTCSCRSNKTFLQVFILLSLCFISGRKRNSTNLSIIPVSTFTLFL